MLRNLIYLLLLLPTLVYAEGMGGILSRSSDVILDPEVAFLLDTEVVDEKTVRFNWQIEEGYYLYQNRFGFKSMSEGVNVSEFTLPPGKEKDDPAFGMVVVNKNSAEILVSLLREQQGGENIQLEVAYQGCKEDSVCYPPIKKVIDFVLPKAMAEEAVVDDSKNTPSVGLKLSEQDAITQQLGEKGLLINLLVFFGFGLLLALTPCVFPMIPILSGIIVGQGKDITTRQAFLLSFFYVLAMALTYAVLGIIAGSFHFNLQSASQNIWVISAFALIFVLLALSMFGFYELQIPAGLQSRLNKLSNKQNAGSLHGAAIMGVLSAIIVGPCVAPPLAGALLYISQTGDALLGGLALFSMGMGFGVPLLVVGTSAGKLLPKAGGWMESIKAVFGVVMLGVAIWFLERILPGSVTLMLWAMLFIVSSIYMGALDKLEGKVGWYRLWKGLGLVMLVYGSLVIVGATTGGRDVLKPLANLSLSAPGQVQAEKGLPFKMIKSLDDLNAELEQASANNKAVMLDFYAVWCVVCNELEEYTFTDEGVHAALDDVVLLKADVTNNDEVDNALLKHFDLFGPPAILFFENQEEHKAYRLVGFIKANDFIEHIQAAISL